MSGNVRLPLLVGAAWQLPSESRMFLNSTLLIQYFFEKYNLNSFGFVISCWNESLLIAMFLPGV